MPLVSRLLAWGILLAAAGTLTPQQAPAAAAETDVSGQAGTVYADCVEAIASLEGRGANPWRAARCIDWIDGFRSGFAFAARGAALMADRKGLDDRVARTMFGCPPDLTTESFIRVFVQGMDARPELFSDDLYQALQSIFVRRYPCKAGR
jgi:hypothetical protein